MHRITRRVTAAVAVAVLGATTLAACSTTPESETPEKLTIWTGQAGELPLEAQNEIARQYTEKTGIEVEVVGKPQPFPGDNTSLATAVGSGNPPDLYVIDRNSLPGQAAIGMLTDLTPFVDEDEDLLANYLEGPVETSSWNGTLYGLPIFASARGLYYNKQVLRDAGVDPAVLDPANGAPTKELITEIAQKIEAKDANGEYERMGFIPWYREAKHMTWNVAGRSQFYDETNCQITPQEPVQLNTFGYEQSEAQRLGYQPTQSFIAAYGSTPDASPLYSGRLGMSIEANTFIDNIAKFAPDLDYGMTYIPVEEEGDEPGTYMGGWSAVIPSGAKHPEASWDLLKFFAGEDGQRQWVEQVGFLPTWKGLYDDEVVEGKEFWVGMLEDYGVEYPPLPVTTAFYSAMDQAQEAVLLGESTPEEALDSVHAQITRQMSPYCPYSIE
jgi:ABC-type glycerol-3-phosphate transport system substrate-binding protein